MVKIHKERLGRGPSKVRSNFAGPDTLVSVLQEALTPAEQKLVEVGNETAVRDWRTALHAATEAEIIATVEQIVDRKVRAFASGVDPKANTVFETFYFQPESDVDRSDG